MKKFAKSSWGVLKRSVVNFVEGSSFTHASSIAFYTIFSLPAILLISLSLGSTLFERADVQRELISQVSSLIGLGSAMEIENILLNAARHTDTWFARVVGIITLVVSATSVFLSLQISINQIWKIKPKPKRGIIKFLINRLLSLAMVISMGFVLMVSLVVDTLLVMFQERLSDNLGGITLVFVTSFNVVMSLLFIAILFGLMFKMLPDAKIRWRDVWVGSLVTTALFTSGKFLIGLYLGSSSLNSAYGAAGSLVIILVWVYYSALIFLFGAELTYVYTKEIGSGIEPYTNAVRVETIQIEKKPAPPQHVAQS
ncbi:MAG: YihY/virulence factor BrkB family protein [Cyclobacteriaceae bacterium]|nr:MAG: YihY/virulence factor BrkB family protein [Cyclobacteriaceae bacterium]